MFNPEEIKMVVVAYHAYYDCLSIGFTPGIITWGRKLIEHERLLIQIGMAETAQTVRKVLESHDVTI